eukprot:6337367-Prorocentrum_lima.AAC.1
MGLWNCARALCSGWRVVTWRGQVSKEFTVNGTIIAGCSLAVGFLKLLLYPLVKQLREEHLQVRVTCMVDDVSIMSFGDEETVYQSLLKAGSLA